MSRQKFILFFVGIYLILSSCTVQEKLNYVQIEILKPSRFHVPISNSTIVIVNRAQKRNDSILVFNPLVKDKRYQFLSKNSHIISARCSEYLVNYLKIYKQFNDIKCFGEISYPKSFVNNEINRDKYFSDTNADIAVFIDSVNVFSKEEGASNYKYKSPMAYIDWSIVWKNDSGYSVFRQDTTLRLPKEIISTHSGKIFYDDGLLNDASYKLAYCMAEIISPKWTAVDRSYYYSKNLTMLEAEEYAQKNEWMRAAEIWNVKTAVKNRRLAGKACYNMALACEMEGKPELASDWVIKSQATTRKSNIRHQELCKEYLEILAQRLKDNDFLKVQMGY